MSYYDQNAEPFFSGTVDVDMGPLYDAFLPHLPKVANILDAGCGSGRDSLYFSKLGHQVVAFDASIELVKLAKQHTGLDVACESFLSFHSSIAFEGIWACASLLHVEHQDLANTMRHLGSLLADGGVFYCSFKYGEGQVERGGRVFTNLTESTLARLLTETPLTVKQTWVTADQRPGRQDEQWLNALLIKQCV